MGKMLNLRAVQLTALVFGLIISSHLLADPMLTGPRIQGGLLQGQATPGARVEIDGEPVRVSPDGVFLVGFSRDHPEQSRILVINPDGSRQTEVVDVARREYKIQRIDGLPKRQVTPSKKDLERIRDDVAQAKRARKHDDDRQDFLSGWIWPVEGPISGVYGSQRILNGEPRRPHFGVDIAMPTGTPVKAPADGVVTLAHPDMFYSGATLILDHGHKLTSSFLHLNKILVKDGDRVKKGDVIAEVGASGRVTGAHLDWRMNYREHRIDPQLLVPPMQKQN
jgi:murein DD-endopeptidase MepM/ murein hydrolase activator NlpD